MWTQFIKRSGIVLGVVMAIVASLPVQAESGARPVPNLILICSPVVVHGTHPLVLRAVVTDRVLNQDWAVFNDPQHPERPPQMVQLVGARSAASAQPAADGQADKMLLASAPAALPGFTQRAVNKPIAVPQISSALAPSKMKPVLRVAIPASATGPLLVHAGDRVHLWSAGANVRLEIEAVAVDYGRAGQVIHLRRLGRTANQGILLTGVVNNDGSAELLP